MKQFVDRVPVTPNRYKLTDSESNVSYVTLERADGATEGGTALNREAFMALQGMEAAETVFNADGSITETYSTGTLVTTLAANGNVVETFTATAGQVITKTTSFNEDGSISEVIS